MADLDACIVTTQATLGNIVKKPKLTEKLLQKPPFRFLHDIVTALIGSGHLPSSMYPPTLLDSANFTEKEAKLEFLNLTISFVRLCLTSIPSRVHGQLSSPPPAPPTAKSGKIVAGLEPIDTNLFLQALSFVCENGSVIDLCRAAEMVAGGEVGEGSTPAPLIGGAASSSKAESKGGDDDDAPSSRRGGRGDAEAESKGQAPPPTDEYKPPASRGGGKRGEPASADSVLDQDGLGNPPDRVPPSRGGVESSTRGGGARDLAPPVKAAVVGGIDIDKEVELAVPDYERTRVEMERVIQKPKLTEKLLSKPPFRFLHDVVTAVITTTGFGEGLYEPEEMDSANVAEKQQKITYLEKIISLVGQSLNTKVDARPAKIVAGMEAENTNVFLQLLALAARVHIERANAGGGAEDKGAAVTEEEEKAVAQPVARAQEKEPRSRQSEPAAAEKEDSPRREQPASSRNRDDDGAKDDARSQSMAQQQASAPAPASYGGGGGDDAAEPKGGADGKSMRPSTARRRPPKVKENTTVMDAKDVAQGVGGSGRAESAGRNRKEGGEAPKGIMKEGDADQFFDDGEDDADGNGEAKARYASASEIVGGKQVSKLVASIVADEEEARRQGGGEAKAGEEKKGIKLTMSLKKEKGVAGGGGGAGLSTAELTDLTEAVQRLVQATAPLGKCMDYVVEDLAQMSKEGERWQGDYRKKLDTLDEARKRAAQELDPLRAALRGVQEEIREVQDKVVSVKKNIKKNEERIRSMLRGVVSN